MNIETLQLDIALYNELVIDSGFKRDIDDYHSSLSSLSSNILGLREVAEKVLSSLLEMVNGDLHNSLARLLPSSKVKPFTEGEFEVDLSKLTSDKDVSLEPFFHELSDILTRLNQSLNQNNQRVQEIEAFISPYLSQIHTSEIEQNQAHASILFKDSETTGKLHQLSKTLQRWNRDLSLYHQLIKSDAPHDVQIVTVQNGSIDFIVNIDVELALDLTDAFKYGFQAFCAYLAYKKLMQPISKYNFGNNKLNKMDAEQEEERLSHIGKAVHEVIERQHEEAKKKDKKINKNQKKSIEKVAELITAHIVRGNDFKLISYHIADSADEAEQTETKDKLSSISNELDEASREARQSFKKLPQEEQCKLIEYYSESNLESGDGG